MILTETLSSTTSTATVITTIVSVLSLIGCVFILFTYAAFKKVRNYAFKLVIYLSVAELVEVGGNLITLFVTQDENSARFLCGLQSFLINYGNLSSMVWSSIIAWCLYSATVLNTKNLRAKNKKFLLAGFGVPLAISGLHWFAYSSGAVESVCTHGDTEGLLDAVFHWVEFYIPLGVVLVFNIYAYSKVVVFIKKYVSTTMETRFIKRLRYYPLVMVACWLVGGLNRIYNFLGFQSSTLDYLDMFMGGLQGFFNGILFLSNSQVKLLWAKKVCCCLPSTMYTSQNDESFERTNDSMEMKSGDDMKRRGIDLNKSIDRSSELSSRGNIEPQELDNKVTE